MSNATVHQSSISTFLISQTNNIDKQGDSTEIKLSIFLAEHNIAFDVANYLTHVIKKYLFWDHTTAQKFSLKCTKANNIIASEYKQDLAKKLKKQNQFSILTDESNVMETLMTSCTVVRHFDADSRKIEVHFGIF